MKSRYAALEKNFYNPKVTVKIAELNRYGFHFDLKFTVRRNVVKFLMWPLKVD